MVHWGGRVADYIERHTNSIASDIRDALDSSSWVPDALRPQRNQSHHFFAKAPPPQRGTYERAVQWISQNRKAIAIVLAFAGTTIFLVRRKRRAHARKRRAKKFANGSKKEIVVLACSTFSDPLNHSLALDLERRGYIVYVTVSSNEEDSSVKAESKPDVRSLWMDMSSSVPNHTDIHPDLQPIRDLLNRSPAPPPSTKSAQFYSQQNLTLAGIIALPGTTGYPVRPLSLLPPSDLIDVVNTRLLAPILTVQKFLPLLAQNADVTSPPAIILAYPSITMSLSPPDSLPEMIATSSMSSFSSVLRRELKIAQSGITVSEIKLGNFDLGTGSARAFGDDSSEISSALTHWHSAGRAAAQRSQSGQPSASKASSVRAFHNAVFDALAPPQTFKAFGRYEWQGSRRPSVVFVGSGARLYDLLGNWMPNGAVGWMMGYNKPSRHYSIIASEKTPNQSTVWGTSSVDNESQVWERV